MEGQCPATSPEQEDLRERAKVFAKRPITEQQIQEEMCGLGK